MVPCGQSSNQVLCKMEEYHLNIETLQLCLWIIASYHLLYGNVCTQQQINLRCTPQVCQPLKKALDFGELKKNHAINYQLIATQANRGYQCIYNKREEQYFEYRAGMLGSCSRLIYKQD